jgi:hypothetical protein
MEAIVDAPAPDRLSNGYSIAKGHLLMGVHLAGLRNRSDFAHAVAVRRAPS